MTIPPITKAEALVERVKISFMTDTTTPAEEKKQNKHKKNHRNIVVIEHFLLKISQFCYCGNSVVFSRHLWCPGTTLTIPKADI